MYGIKSTSNLETGDILVANASVNARVLPLSFSPVIFITGQTMGTVTNADRTGTDGKTYVDFKDNQGRILTIEKGLTYQPLASVGYQANPNYNYPSSISGLPAAQTSIVPGDNPTGAKTQSGGLFGKILGGLETVRDIIVGVKKTPINTTDEGDDTSIDIGTINTQKKGDPKPAGDSSLYWMIGGGLAIVGATIGIFVYLKKRKKRVPNPIK